MLKKNEMNTFNPQDFRSTLEVEKFLNDCRIEYTKHWIRNNGMVWKGCNLSELDDRDFIGIYTVLEVKDKAKKDKMLKQIIAENTISADEEAEHTENYKEVNI